MSSASMDAKRRCENCLEYVEIYITCFKCDAAYHIYCWKKVPGAYVNERGQLFCCSSLTSNYATINTNSRTQGNPSERVIEKENVDGYKEDLENYPIKQEDSEWNEFKCDACHLEFTNKEYLENHYSECPNKEGGFIQEFIKEDKDLENCLYKEENLEWSEFRCSACLLEFANKEQLIHHYSECPNKDREFIQELKEDKAVENTLSEEENSEPNEGDLENDCSQSPNKRGGSFLGLNKDKVGLSCPFCNEEDFQNESYEQHIKRCPVESSCSRFNKDNDICITNTKGNAALVDDKQKTYKRTVCDHSTCVKECVVKRICIHSNEIVQKTTLNDHILAKHSNADKRYKCRDCEYFTHIKARLINHIRTHTQEKPFKCDMCDYAATQKTTLNDHILTKHSNADKQYKCGDCEYSTHIRANLVRHIRTHTKEKPFKCDMCGYTAARSRDLKKHVLVEHSNEDLEYKCKDCEYSTHMKAALVRHIRTHTNEKPFKCDMCDYAAIQKTNLNDHILTKHSNADKQYKCRECEYSTHIKGSLVRHSRTHTYEIPFKCDMCDYAAARKIDLKKHLSAKHYNADKEYKCRNCEYSTHTTVRLINHICTHTN